MNQVGLCSNFMSCLSLFGKKVILYLLVFASLVSTSCWRGTEDDLKELKKLENNFLLPSNCVSLFPTNEQDVYDNYQLSQLDSDAVNR